MIDDSQTQKNRLVPIQPTQISELLKSGNLIINDGYRARNSELSDKGIPFARAQNISNGFNFENSDKFAISNLDKVGIKKSLPGDVVFTSKGTVGRFAFVQVDTPQFVYSPQLCFWRSLNKNCINPRWLYYWMNSREFFIQFSGVSGQTDMADYVNLRDQKKMVISLPNISEQRRIAHILGSLDDKIELNRQMNETLEAMAGAIFKSWLVDFDPVRAKAEGRHPAGMDAETAALFPDNFEEVEGRGVPRGWRVKPLDEIADFLNGLALQKYPAKTDDQYLPVIKISQLHAGNTIGSDKADINIPPEYIIEDGDILFSWSGSLAVTVWCGGKGALNQHLFKVSSELFPKWFYYQWVLQYLPDFRLIAEGKATTMGHIQRHHLSETMALVPPPKQIEVMDKMIAPLFDKIISNNIESRIIAEIRDSLLPKLMSGKLHI